MKHAGLIHDFNSHHLKYYYGKNFKSIPLSLSHLIVARRALCNSFSSLLSINKIKTKSKSVLIEKRCFVKIFNTIPGYITEPNICMKRILSLGLANLYIAIAKMEVLLCKKRTVSLKVY